MSSLPVLTFGALLRRYRLAAGLSQEALAEQAHLSREAISTLERGSRRAPRQETLDLLVDALQLPPAARSLLYAAARGQPLADLRSDLQRSSGRHPNPSLPLVGRQGELALLERHLAGEELPFLVLAGEPGIGKTRLLREASRRASEAGWTVLEGSCHRRSGQEPYTPLLGALEEYLRRSTRASLRAQLEGCAWLVRLLPELAETTLVPSPSWSLPPEQERRLLFAAVSRFLANVAGPAGTLLLLDDLQWAGADALDLLATLLRSPAHPPVRIIGAYRTTEAHATDVLSDLLADLAVAGLATQHQLEPLAPQEAAELLDLLLEGEEDEHIERRAQILTRTGGVPFFLVSCAQGQRTGTAEMERGKVPWNVAESIHQRVAALSPSAQEVLAAAAIIGRNPPGRLLQQVAGALGLSQREVIAAAEHLNQARLLVEAEQGGYLFPHDLIREVVQDHMSRIRRTTLHQQIAEALEQEPGVAPIEQLAYHYSRAGNVEKAGIYLERAGDHALALHANSEAAGYYQQLRELLDAQHQPREAARIGEKFGEVLILLSRYEEALAALDQAVEAYRAMGNAEGQARGTAKIGLIYTRTGVLAEGIARLEAMAASLQGPRPSHGLAELYTSLGYLYGENNGGYRQQLECIGLAEHCAPDAYHTPIGRTWRARRASSLILLGDLEAALAILEDLLPEAQVAGDAEGQRTALYVLAALHFLQGAFAQERACIEQALDVAERMGDLAWQAILRHRRGRNAFHQGNWKEAHQDIEYALSKLPQGIAGAGGEAPFSLGLLSLAEGKWAQAQQVFEDILGLAEAQGELLNLRWIHTALAERELLQGQPAQARARLEPLLDRSGEEEMAVTQLLPMLAWAHLDLEGIEQASSTIQQAKMRAETRQMRPALAEALRIQALLCIRQQRWDKAQKALEEALALCREMPYPYAEAKALYVYGLLRQAKGEPAQARARLEAALTILNQLGERLYAEQVERALTEGT